MEQFGRIDVLVNNAGTGAAGAAEESSVAQDQRVFDINFFGLPVTSSEALQDRSCLLQEVGP